MPFLSLSLTSSVNVGSAPMVFPPSMEPYITAASCSLHSRPDDREREEEKEREGREREKERWRGREIGERGGRG